MSKFKHGNATAMREFMLSGNKISRLEGILLFGVQNLTAVITTIRRDGYTVKQQRVSMIKILKRVNQYAACKPAKELPAKDVIMTEYWIGQ